MVNAKVIPGTTQERRVIGLALALGCILLLLDQLTKSLIVASFARQGESVTVIDNFFNIRYVTNTGAAWGMLSGYGWLLLLVGVSVIVFSIIFLRYLTEGYIERYFAIFVILSGVIGNSIDRVARGAVVDFLDFYIGSYHWPTFNVADIAICVGTIIFILSSMTRGRNEKAQENSEDNLY